MLRTLGGLELQDSSFNRPKPLLLLVYLALDGPRPRRHLAELFWPTAASPTGSLSKAVSLLRQGAGAVLEDDGNALRCLVDTDVDLFLQALDAQQYDEAVGCYQGPFLLGVELDWGAELEEWVLRKREFLADRQRAALLRLGQQAAAAGEPNVAAKYAQQAYFLRSAPEPDEEDLERLHELLAAAGDPLAKEVRREAAAFGLELSYQRPPAEHPPSERPSAESPSAEAVTTPPPMAENPYKGLGFFREEDAELFFGRGDVTDELVRAIQRKPPVVALIGSSGSGKSSLVFAGLIPALRRLGRWQVAALRPGRDPFLALALALVPWLRDEMSEVERLQQATALAAALRDGSLSLPQVLEQALQQHPEERALLVVDQAEELFTISEFSPGVDGESAPPAAHAFLTMLLRATERADNRFGLVLTIRADFMATVLEYGALVPVLQRGQFLLGPMTRDELREVIEAPAALRGVTLEEGLGERILQDVAGQSGSLPLLEFALSQLWGAQEQGRLTHRAYDAIGGVEQALTQHAEQSFQNFSADEQQQIQQIFLQLVAPGEGREDTRRVASRKELAEQWPLVGELASAPIRLIVTGRNEQGEETAEVVHEALIRRWSRLRGWLDEYRGFRIWQERFRQEVALWRSLDGDASALLRGFRLDEAVRRLEEAEAMFTADEKAFVEAGVALRRRELEQEEQRRAQQERAQRERGRLQRRVTQLLGAMLAVAVVLTGLAGWQWRLATARGTQASLARANAEAQAQLALARQLSAQALVAAQLPGLTNGYFDRALLLASQANLLVADDPESYGALLRVFQSLPPQLEAFVPTGYDVWTVAFSPDGWRLAGGGDEPVVSLWNLAAQERPRVVLEGHEKQVRSVAFSPDGSLLASGSSDGTIILWDATSHEPLGPPLTGHSDEVLSVAFSPDGSLLASGSRDGTVILWDLSSRTALGRLEQERAFPISSVAFSPDGALVAGGNRNNSVLLWSVATRTAVGPPLQGHRDQVRSVAFSPDGEILASGSRDGTIILWSVADREPLGPPLEGHAGEVRSVAFSPDGEILASGGSGGSILLWRLEREEQLAEVIQELGASGNIFSVAFSPDGATLASGSSDGTVILWDLSGDESADRTPQRVEEAAGDVRSVALSPDGTLLASGGRSGTIVLHRLGGEEASPRLLSGHQSWVRTLAFGPVGGLLVSGHRDGTLTFWDTGSGEPLAAPLEGHGDEIRSVAFSQDGRLLASGSSDGTVILWDVARREALGPPLEGHGDWVMDVAFSPDGSLLASGSRDGTVLLWSVADREQLGPPLRGHDGEGHDGEVRSVAFGAAGAVLASGGSDGKIVLWSVEGGSPLAEPLALPGAGNEVWSLEFSRDGQTLAVGGRDGTLVRWGIGPQALLQRACRLAGRNLDAEEWRRYLDGLPPRPTCPEHPDSSVVGAGWVVPTAG